MSALLQLAMAKAHGKGKSLAAARRRKAREAVLHPNTRGAVFNTSDGRSYVVDNNGTIRRQDPDQQRRKVA